VRWVYVTAAFMVLSSIALSISLYMGANDRAELADVARRNCLQIEELKSEFRREAIHNFEQFDRNTELLGIDPSPELRTVAEQERDRTIVRLAPHKC
jgi:hypothetical protein